MNIGSTSNSLYVATSGVAQGPNTASVNRASDGDADRGGQVHRGHKGGGIGQALMQALQDMGLTVPQQGNPPSAQGNASTSGATDSDGDQDGSGSASGVKNDVRNLMHALFQAVKSENPSAGSTTSPADPKSGFAGGLSALISQVSSGSAPAGLQSAFDKLIADMQKTGTTSPSTPADSANAASSATLQQLLSQLQENLGYGASNGVASIGNLVSITA